jgi:amino acid transporter
MLRIILLCIAFIIVFMFVMLNLDRLKLRFKNDPETIKIVIQIRLSFIVSLVFLALMLMSMAGNNTKVERENTSVYSVEIISNHNTFPIIVSSTSIANVEFACKQGYINDQLKISKVDSIRSITLIGKLTSLKPK